MLEITWSEISLYSLYLEILSVHSINVFYCKTYKRGRCLGKKGGRQESKGGKGKKEGNSQGEKELPQDT